MKRCDVVAAGSRPAAEAAEHLLRAGGNAFDAAVGAVFASMVSEPTLTSPAGGGHLMALKSDGESCLYDFFVDRPRGGPEPGMDFFRVTVDFGAATQDFHIGRAAVAVPGTAAGLSAVQRELGRLPPADVVAPAVALAEAGTPLADIQAEFVRLLYPILAHDPASRRLFSPSGEPLRAGETFRNPELASTLRMMAREGASLFYGGEIGRRLSDWRGSGGLLDTADLEEYRVHRRAPLEVVCWGHTWLLNPPPAHSGEGIQTVLSAVQECGDDVQLGDVLAAMEPLRPRRDPGSGSTTHVSVLDRDGNAASVTTTNGEGCGYLIEGTGVMPNNMLGEEDLNPDGFHHGPRGARLSTAMAPTILLRAGEPVLLAGSSGSERIRSALLQVIFHHLVRGETIEKATAHPRAHLEGDTLHVEPGLGGELLAALAGAYSLRSWPQQSVFFGGVNSVTQTGGAADARREGCSIVID